MKEEKLREIYAIEMNDPVQWKLIFPELSRDDFKAYIKFKSTIKSTNTGDIGDRIFSPVTRNMKWASSRWNDGNYDILYEMRTRLDIYESYQKKAITSFSALSDYHVQELQRMQKHEEVIVVDSTYSPFSNFYKCAFKTNDKTEYHSIVQYMAAYKARLFEDQMSLEKIMQNNDPYDCYKLGLNVKFFDRDYWQSMYSGNHLTSAIRWKILQNEDLRTLLLSTKGKLFAFAGLNNNWCTGLDQASTLQTSIRKWPGLNAMGELLTEIRDELIL